MMRIVALAVAALLAPVAIAQAGTVLRAGAEAASYANFDTPVRTFQVPAKQKRLRVTFTAQALIRPYTYDADYNKTYLPDQVVDVSGNGSLSLRCIRKGEEWWESADASRTLKPGVTLIPLTVRNAWRCRVSASGSTLGSDTPPRSNTVTLTTTLVVVTAR
jgi:hypothetical protein